MIVEYVSETIMLVQPIERLTFKLSEGEPGLTRPPGSVERVRSGRGYHRLHLLGSTRSRGHSAWAGRLNWVDLGGGGGR